MRRTGYSYVEMLVVITFIGILVALLLPAVQAAREAGRRMYCGRNLSQLIGAVQNYELHHGFYPPGTIDAQRPIFSQPVGYHHNWITQVLPYLEQKSTYAHIDFSVGVYDPRHSPVRQLELRILRCPSTARTGKGYTDYAGVHNDVETPIDVTNNGVFFLNSRICYEDLKDGSTQTMFIGEKWTPIGDLGWMSGTRATLRNLGVTIGSGRATSAPSPTGFPPGVQSDGRAVEKQLNDQELMDVLLGSSLVTMALPGEGSGRRPYVLKRPKDVRLAVGAFGSPHPGGAQFALGDGSVRFFSGNASYEVLFSFANRADGQLLDSDDY